MPDPRPAPESLHGTIAAALAALDRAGVSWCVLRGDRELEAPESPAEVDLLVAAAELRDVRAALRPLGFAPLPAWGRGSHRFFVAYDEDRDFWLKLDLVTELDYGSGYALRTRAAEDCLSRRVRLGDLAVLDADDAFWTLLLHCLLDRGGVPPRHAERLLLLSASARSQGPLACLVEERACPDGWDADRLVRFVREGAWLELFRLAPRMSGVWARRRPLEVWSTSFLQLGLRRFGKLLRPLRHGGPRIVLLGPDGAGKSTLAEGLRRSFYLPTHSFYAGLYPARAHRSRLGLLGRLLRLRRASLAASYHQARGRLVVFDRYPYDALLPTASGEGARSRIRRWILSHACRRPDLVVLLDAPAELLHARKGEQTGAVLAEQRRKYLALAARMPRLLAVDAGRTAEEVRRAVTAAIWRAHAAREWRGAPEHWPGAASRPSAPGTT